MNAILYIATNYVRVLNIEGKAEEKIEGIEQQETRSRKAENYFPGLFLYSLGGEII